MFKKSIALLSLLLAGMVQADAASLETNGELNIPIAPTAEVDTQAFSSFLQSTPAVGPSVFLGGISHIGDLTSADAMKDVLATKKIGLYLMPLGVQVFMGQANYNKAAALFNPIGKAMGEFGYGPVNSYTQITVSNTTSSDIILTDVGTYFTDKEGNKWYYTSTGTHTLITGVSSCQSWGGSGWVTKVPANSSCPINITEDVVGANTLDASDSFTSSVAGLTVTSFLPITTSGTGSSYGVIGDAANKPTQSVSDAFGSGTYAWSNGTVTMSAVNINDGMSHTPSQVAQWKVYVDAMRAKGVKVVAPYLRAGAAFQSDPYKFQTYYLEDYATEFDQSPAMTGIKDEIIYGGGVALDWPPVFTSGYGEGVTFYNMSICKWALEHNLECIVTVAPPKAGNGGYLQDLKMISNYLAAHGASPTRWAVENYEINLNTSPWSETCNAIGTANDTTKADVVSTCSDGSTATYKYNTSLNAAALMLANSGSISPPPADNLYLTSNGDTVPMTTTGLGQRGTLSDRISSTDLMDGQTLIHAESVGVGPGHLIPRNDPVGNTLSWGYISVGWGFNTTNKGYGYCVLGGWCLTDSSASGSGLGMKDGSGNYFLTIDSVLNSKKPLAVGGSVPDTWTFSSEYVTGWNSDGTGNAYNANWPGLGVGGYTWYQCTNGQSFSDCKNNTIGKLTSTSNFYVNTYGALDKTYTLSRIQGSAHAESDTVWCHDCRASGQAAGAGTGRWITLGSDSKWYTQDGVEAAN